jgi:hypothetical protein
MNAHGRAGEMRSRVQGRRLGGTGIAKISAAVFCGWVILFNMPTMQPKKVVKVVLPPNFKPVLVQCEGFRGLAYHTNEGVWKRAINHRKLPAYVEILPVK